MGSGVPDSAATVLAPIPLSLGLSAYGPGSRLHVCEPRLRVHFRKRHAPELTSKTFGEFHCAVEKHCAIKQALGEYAGGFVRGYLAQDGCASSFVVEVSS
jgi:hypothetical protein